MRPLAIAHRAGNSLAALAAAVAAGVDVIEADVHGHDGRLEVRHLKTMGPLPYLWDTWELVPASAPRLELGEVLRAARPGTLFMLDVKGTAEVGADVAVAAVAAVHEVAPGHDVIVCSRVWPAVEAVSELPYVRPVLSPAPAASWRRCGRGCARRRCTACRCTARCSHPRWCRSCTARSRWS
jgi:hypothetical protein